MDIEEQRRVHQVVDIEEETCGSSCMTHRGQTTLSPYDVLGFLISRDCFCTVKLEYCSIYIIYSHTLHFCMDYYF